MREDKRKYNKQMTKQAPKKLILGLIFFIFALTFINLENQKKAQKILGAKTQLKLDQQSIDYWEQILVERPNYRDGWVQLAAGYYKIGNKEKAQEAIAQAKRLDPQNELILNFEKLIAGLGQ